MRTVHPYRETSRELHQDAKLEETAITSLFHVRPEDSDSTEFFHSEGDTRVALQFNAAKHDGARKYAFLSVHSPVRFDPEVLRESL